MSKSKDGAHVVFYRKLKAKGGRRIPAVFLTKRTLDAPSDQGDWGLVGGTRDDEDMTPKDTVLREIDEEIEYQSRLRVVPLCNRRLKKNTVYFFKARLQEDMDTLRLKRNDKGKVEGEGLGWFTKAELRSLRVRPQDRPAINRYFTTVS